MRKILLTLAVIVVIFLVALTGGSFYMLNYSLAPDPGRHNTDSIYRQLFQNYPDTQPWVDSLRQIGALRDTFLTMPAGHRCHAYYIHRSADRTAIVIHGWRDQAAKFFYLAKMYERELGYNVVVPDLYASGQSEGDAIRMGWLDRLDILEWVKAFRQDTMVIHGVSMGAATTMMTSGEQLPASIRSLHFVADCGYTSVWDEFSGQLREQFGLPPFPLLYSSSLLCSIVNGWSFSEASALRQVAKCPWPMLFIHGDSDDFVPTEMVHRLYAAKPDNKELWITANTDHARSFKNHPQEYILRVRQFLAK